MDFIFSVHKFAKFSSNPGKVHFEVLVHLLRYIRYNNSFGLKFYDDMKDAPLSYLLIQASINTENKFNSFSDSSWQSFSDTSSTVAYIVFYQGGPIDHGKHVPASVAQPSA